MSEGIQLCDDWWKLNIGWWACIYIYIHIYIYIYIYIYASLMAQMVVSVCSAGDPGSIRSLGWEDSLEKEMAVHSIILAWEIPWTEEPGGATVHGVTKRYDWAHSTLCLVLLFKVWKTRFGDFPGSPVFRALLFQCRGTDSIPGWGSRILHVTQPKKKKKIPNKQKTTLVFKSALAQSILYKNTWTWSVDLLEFIDKATFHH